MKYEDEFPVANGPMKSSYSPGEEQAARMEGHLGPELNRRLEIAAAQMWVIDRVRSDCKRQLDYIKKNYAYPSPYTVAYGDMLSLLSELEQEVKGEL